MPSGAIPPKIVQVSRSASWSAAASLTAGAIALFFALNSANALGATGAAALAAAALAALYAALRRIASRHAPAVSTEDDLHGADAAPAATTMALPEPDTAFGIETAKAVGGTSGTLAGADAWLRHFYDHAPLGIAVLDDAGRVLENNTAFRSIAGLDEESGDGVRLHDIVREDDRAELASRLGAARKDGARGAALEVGIGDANRTLAQLHLGRVGEAAAGQSGLIAYLVDTTEQSALEEQFVQSQKMQAVGQLAGGIAHDFNNLLTAMIGFCDLLLLRHAPGDQSFADIMQIKQNANRAAGLVRQLLAFSRRQTLQPKTLNLTDVLAELSHLLRRLIGETITLNLVHDRDLGLVKVDQGQLEQVIINLAVNARDAMSEGGVLGIETANVTFDKPQPMGHERAPAGEYVRVEVRDTGSGIATQHIDKIFEPFFSTKDAGSGTGLGLSTV